MKAIVIRDRGRGVEAWKLAERERPEPGPGQIVVRVHAASLNYRDLMVARGSYGGPTKDELVPLSDGAGEVVALGSGTTRWALGDRVIGAYYPDWLGGPARADLLVRSPGAGALDGMLAEYAVLPESAAVRVPEHLSYEEASTLPCAAVTAWTALHGGGVHVEPGASLLVQGTGGVSIFAAQLARASGVRVIATTSSAAKAERLRELGVSEVVDYRKTPEWQQAVLDRTNGAGVDHVIEVGGPGTLERSFEAVRFGGTIHLIGLLTGTASRIDPLPILYRGLQVRGVRVGSVEAFEALDRALAVSVLRPVIDEVFPFERAPEALAKLASGAHFGKIVVRVNA